MAKKRRSKGKTGKSTAGVEKKFSRAGKSFILFLVFFAVSFILYSFATNSLLINFFAILSIIFGFLAFTFLIALIVLLIIKSGKR